MTTRKKILPLIISLFFTFAFGYVCPTWGPVTAMGIKMLGVLIGWLILAATGFGLLVPSLIAMCGCVLSGYYTTAQVLAKGLGSSAVMLVILIFVIVYVFSSSKTAEYIVRRCLSMRFLNGRPYLLVFILFLVFSFMFIIMGSFGPLAIAIVMLIKIAEVSKMNIKDDCMRFILMGLVALVGVGITLPYSGSAAMYISLFDGSLNTIGTSINGGTHALTCITLALGAIGALLLAARFILQLEFKELKALNVTELRTDEFLKMTVEQKIIFITVLIGMFFPAIILIIPKTSAIYATFAGLGQVMILALCIAFLSLIRINGKPLMNTREAFAKGVNWDIVFALACVSLIGSALGSEDAGFTPWILGLLSGWFESISPLFIVLLVTLVSVVFTQFFSNLATATILCSIMGPLTIAMYNSGLNVSVFPAIIGVATCSACLIPAGSGQAALMLTTDIFAEDGQSWALKKGFIVLGAVFVGFFAGAVLSFMLY